MARKGGLTGVLVIVGTGEKTLLRAIEDEVSSAGVESSVQLVLRFVSVEELQHFYEAADILVYPYSEITTSGALMTGVGFGKAIVASALPGFEQLLRHNDNALLVRYGDVDSLANALVRLAGDRELRLRLARRLRGTRAHLPRWVDIAKQTSRWYHAVLSSGAEPGNC
jgi:glycosyltransferase involved in cell wall biosynthesis